MFRNENFFLRKSYIKNLTNITFPHSMPDGCYFITITLKPEVYKHTVRKQFLMTVERLESCLRVWSSEYWLAPELTKQNNIHYHCICKFSDKIQYAKEKYIDTMKTINLFGFVHIGAKDVEDKMRTWNYLTKDINKTTDLINMKKGDYDILRYYKKNDEPPKKRKVLLLNKLIKLDNDSSDTEFEIMMLYK